ncbi:hypothetical protein [Micromonospora sp. NBS 11-29]|nr:hypothetical protein [Micromonospora sp. NBS 11-29]
MFAPPCTPSGGTAAHPTGVTLVKRRHVDLMRVCSDGCRAAR